MAPVPHNLNNTITADISDIILFGWQAADALAQDTPLRKFVSAMCLKLQDCLENGQGQINSEHFYNLLGAVARTLTPPEGTAEDMVFYRLFDQATDALLQRVSPALAAETKKWWNLSQLNLSIAPGESSMTSMDHLIDKLERDQRKRP
jgi:hypothetical protein